MTTNTNNLILRGEPVDIKFPNHTIGQILFACGKKYAERICQIDAYLDEKETYASVHLRSVRLACVMQKWGITHKDVVVNCSKNRLDASIPLFATWFLGAKVANFDPSLSVQHTEHLIKLIEPSLIFVEEASIDLINEALQNTAIKPKIVVYANITTKYPKFEELLEPNENENNFQPIFCDLDEIALMFFSSGTTGQPKAICHNHKSLFASNIVTRNTSLDLKVFFHFSSLYWVSAVYMLVSLYIEGGTRVFTTSFASEHLFQLIQRYKVTLMFILPSLSYLFTEFNRKDDYDISSMKHILCGGAAINPTQQKKFITCFKDATIIVCYGLSETGFVSGFHPEKEKELANSKIGSVGRPVNGVQIKIVDVESNKILGSNENGQIWINTPSKMMGYYRVDSSDQFDKDGFIKTGDLGYYDEDGCLYLIDRLKEMFKFEGYHVVPSVLEKILDQHSAVKESVVFGIKDDRVGYWPVACVVLKPNCQVNEKELQDYVSQKVSEREKLKSIIFIESLTKGPSGKVLKSEVKKKYAPAFNLN